MPRRPARVLDPTTVLERRIKAHLKRHLLLLGFEREADGSLKPPSATKDAIRSLHRLQRLEKLRENDNFLSAKAQRLLPFFADGSEIRPELVSPRLELIRADTVESDLFRMASLLWSIPVSQGYGRRMRFLVWDESIGKVMGVIGIGDPSFNLAARDKLIGWSSADREERLVDLMDAFILGAVPPYSALLGGKLVASLVRTREVVDAFRRKYSDSVGLLSGERKRPRLVAVTTTSALGRSSLYNRLTLGDVRYFNPIGYTGGWGHFHIPRALFEEMRQYLALRGHSYAHGNEFGDGPNWRLRSIRASLDLMGFDADMLRHGVVREVFISWLADNAMEVLTAQTRRPIYRTLLSASEVGELGRERWLAPRAARDDAFREWTKGDLLDRLDWRVLIPGRARTGQ